MAQIYTGVSLYATHWNRTLHLHAGIVVYLQVQTMPITVTVFWSVSMQAIQKITMKWSQNLVKVVFFVALKYLKAQTFTQVVTICELLLLKMTR